MAATSTKATLSIEIDKDVKEIAEQLLENVGLDPTTAIEMFYRQMIQDGRLPFQIEAAMTLDEHIMEIVRKKNIEIVSLEYDENGNLTVDKDKHPRVYDWIMNG